LKFIQVFLASERFFDRKESFQQRGLLGSDLTKERTDSITDKSPKGDAFWPETKGFE